MVGDEQKIGVYPFPLSLHILIMGPMGYEPIAY